MLRSRDGICSHFHYKWVRNRITSQLQNYSPVRLRSLLNKTSIYLGFILPYYSPSFPLWYIRLSVSEYEAPYIFYRSYFCSIHAVDWVKWLVIANSNVYWIKRESFPSHLSRSVERCWEWPPTYHVRVSAIKGPLFGILPFNNQTSNYDEREKQRQGRLPGFKSRWSLTRCYIAKAA